MSTTAQTVAPLSRRTLRRVFVACIIAAAHVAVVLLTIRNSVQSETHEEPVLPMVAEILESQPPSFLSLHPELSPAEVTVKLGMPDLPAIEAAELSLRPPMIDPEMQLDVSSYNARAGLPVGVVATVILLLEIGPDGSVMSAEVTRSNAEATANEVALDYAKATQWMPGRVDGEPRAMQASLTVILGERP
jgi:hypothetical protein